MNEYPFKVDVPGGRVPFVREFKEQINAELYIMVMEGSDDYNPSPRFTPKYSESELIVEKERQDKLLKEAKRLQNQAWDRTRRSSENPKWNPCEVCDKRHPTYECCDKCNYDNHRCHFCGDGLGHSEVSVCYILEGLGE